MKIIPVIDLKAGQVVHAVRGMRDQYQPIHSFSRITQSCTLEQVVQDLLRLHAFDCFYIADLDAIGGQGDHRQSIERLQERYPAIEFWIDAGTQLSQIRDRHPKLKTIIGTESQQSAPYLIEQNYLLSLDFNQQALGNPAWFKEHHYWPSTVILMTLSRVGSNSGPDLEKLAEFATMHPDKSLIAAGGIRHYQDLQQLADLQISGALIATALHSGVITGQQIAELQAKKYPGKPGYF